MPTSSTALAGKAINTPTKPNSWPKAIKAKITAIGCRPMRSPSKRGVTYMLSTTCPTPYTTPTSATPSKA